MLTMRSSADYVWMTYVPTDDVQMTYMPADDVRMTFWTTYVIQQPKSAQDFSSQTISS